MCRSARLFSLAVLAFVVIGSCSRAKVVTAPKPLDTSARLGVTALACGSSKVLSLGCAAFPITDAVKQPDWDYFAWNSFIATNWPAIDPASNNEQRGFPDLTKSFAGATSTDLLAWETHKEKRNVTPCFTGAIHLKAAWILLQNENPSQYHTAEAAYFKSENGKKCMAYGTFGLIGLHIIQRIHQGTGSVGNPQGGTFIFATWEHVNNDSAGFTYSNFFPGQPFFGPPKRGFYPNPAYALPVKRQFPILPGTVNVNNAVHAALPASSVWQNYELVGVQFQPIKVTSPIVPGGSANDPTNIGQPLFLANSVIETNQGLQNFQGLPPFAAPIAKFQKNGIVKNGAYAFNRNTPNVSFNRSAINMGGCMGCHGVAQVKGFSFSFVLLGGQQGADVDTEDSFTVPPPPSQ